jgi:hypothetical protein
MAIYLFNVKTFVVFFLSLILLIDKGGVGLLFGVHLLHLTPPEVTLPPPLRDLVEDI